MFRILPLLSVLCLTACQVSYRRGDIVIAQIDDEHHIKSRVMALPGDTIAIEDACLLVDGSDEYETSSARAEYCISRMTPLSVVHKMQKYDNTIVDTLFRSNSRVDAKATLPVLKRHQEWNRYTYSRILANIPDSRIYPWEKVAMNNAIHMHSFVLPEKGMCVNLNKENRLYYEPLIAQEDKRLDIQQTDTYTFRYNYYFLLNDDRLNINDSRHWGPVRADQIIR